jgi:hypothetical protein
MTARRLSRETFQTSRLLEFCTRRELAAQTGHDVEDWPLVIAKELTDNAIDIAEEAGIPPVVAIAVSTEGEIIVSDNGPGMPPETVEAIIDFSTRTSSREAYVSPTRGAQGNALKTVLAMPFVLGPDAAAAETVIEARGITHRIRFAVDPIRQEPRITCDRATSSVRNGTRVTVRWPVNACHLLDAARGRFLPLAVSYLGLNPHLAITADWWNGDRLVDWTTPTNPAWEKWRPSDPIPIHWYTAERLQRYIAACVNRDMEHGVRVRSVRDFVGDFRGLSSTVKRSAVLGETHLIRAALDVFFNCERVDHAGIAQLLEAMKRHSRPVKPESLGLIGEDHWRHALGSSDADWDGFRYARILGEDDDLPFVVEAAFIPDPTGFEYISGINWSAAIGDPYRSLGRHGSLWSVLANQHIGGRSDVAIGIHFASPTVSFTDRGKSTIALSRAGSEAINTAVLRVTKDWATAQERKRREDARHHRAVVRQIGEEQKAARAAAKRRRATTVGTGVLYAEIAKASKESGLSITALTVLSDGNDPYRFDTTTGHENGQWFKAQVDRFVAPDRQIHLRGLFYKVVSVGDVKRPTGSPIVNNWACWKWFLKAASAARYLKCVPLDRISDERSAEPIIIEPAQPRSGSGDLSTGGSIGIEVPSVDACLPFLVCTRPVAMQPYRIIMIGEKSSLAEVLRPIAEMVKASLYLGPGEMTLTRVAEAVALAAEDGRPAVVLEFVDLDPAGHQMSISVARKLQALRTSHYPNLKVQLHRVALTIEQVRELNLPSTPLKPKEKRAIKWREKMGHEQTEIDALAALRPDLLRQITLEALKPFFDFGLARRCADTAKEWWDEAQKKFDAHPERPEIEASIRTARADVEAAAEALKTTAEALEKVQADAVTRLQQGEAGIGSTVIRAPEVQIEAKPPPPLFSTDDDFVTATLKLIANKALDDGDEDEQ